MIRRVYDRVHTQLDEDLRWQLDHRFYWLLYARYAMAAGEIGEQLWEELLRQEIGA